MKHTTKEDKIEHLKESIKVCEEKIIIEGENGSKNWIQLKQHFEKELKRIQNEK